MSKVVVESEDYARWVLDDAEVRASARRQLKFGLPVLLVTMFAAAFAFGNPPAPQTTAPTSTHAPRLAPAYPGSMVG